MAAQPKIVPNIPIEEKDKEYKYFPFAQPFGFSHKFTEAIGCETVVALPFNASLFPAHAVGFRDHFASEHVVLEESLLLLYLQACLHVKPSAVVISSAFTTEEYEELGKNADAAATMAPARQTLFLIPMTTEMLSDALTFINDRVRPVVSAEPDRFNRRKPAENIVPGMADWRRIRSPTMLAKAVQAMINDTVRDVDLLLTSPNIAVDASQIAADPEYAGHLLHYCNAERRISAHGSEIMSASGTPVLFQNKPGNYFSRVNNQVMFQPVEEFDEYTCLRCLNSLDQAILFGDTPDANLLLRMHFPTMQAPWQNIKNLVRNIVESKISKRTNVDAIHPRSLILNGLTAREIRHGNYETEHGTVVVNEADLPIRRRFPDPQQTAMMKDTVGTTVQLGMDRNDWLTQIGYPAQFRLQETMSRLLAEAMRADESRRLDAVCGVYKTAFEQLNDVLSDPTNNLFPTSLNKLYQERIAIRERIALLKQKEPAVYAVLNKLLVVDRRTRDFGGDTNARILNHIVLMLNIHLGAMSNQIYPMIMGLLLVWNMIISYDNNKHAAALIGTPASGKSKMWEWIVVMCNACLFKLMGDQSAAAENYTDKDEVDFVLRLWDEKEGLGGEKRSKELSDSRQGATMKTMLAEGYLTNNKPEKVTINGRETLQAVNVVTPARCVCIFLRNTRGNRNSPIEDRLQQVQVNDPPTEEHNDALLSASATKRVLSVLGLAGQAIGTQQLILHLPGHAGLHNGCDQTLLPIAMTVYLAEGLQPPLGRQLKQVTRLIRSVTYQRVAAELTRIGENISNTKDFEDWELSLAAQANMVSSPSDIMAGMALYYGCAGQDSAWDDVMATLVTLLQRKYTTQADDQGDDAAGPAVNTLIGFATHKTTHYVLARCGRMTHGVGRTEDMLEGLVSRVYHVQKGHKGGETASQPVIRQLMEDLQNYQVDGEAALQIVEWQDPTTKTTELRWSISQTVLHTASLPQMKNIVAKIAKLQDLRMFKKPCRADLLTPCEQFWLIPLYADDPVYCGSLVLTPHEFLTFPNTEMKRIAADLIAINPNNAKKGFGKLTPEDYDHQIRFFERMYAEHFEITQSNQVAAVRKVDPNLNNQLNLSEDGAYALEPVTITGQCLKVSIVKFQEIVSNKERPNAFMRASNIIRAIMMPEEALDPATMTRFWLGLVRNKDLRKMETLYLEPTDLSDVRITMRDLSYKKETDETDAFLGSLDALSDSVTNPIWPGTHPMCTYTYGDDLYGKALEANFAKMGLLGPGAQKYKLLSHLQLRPQRKRTYDGRDPM